MAENKSSTSLEESFKKELSAQFYDVIKRTIMSEKATRLAEFENKLVFEVHQNATRPMIKLLIENEFGKKVKHINILKNIKGGKNAIVTFKDQGVASDLSSELGMI